MWGLPLELSYSAFLLIGDYKKFAEEWIKMTGGLGISKLGILNFLSSAT